MKKFMVFLSGVAFIVLISLSANAQDDPKKKKTETTKAKTECCTKAKTAKRALAQQLALKPVTKKEAKKETKKKKN